MNRLLSIIIPTKDRYATLFQVVESIVNNVTSSEYEIVISDNTVDNTEAEDFLKSPSVSEKVTYSHYEQPLSMVENAERAFSLATGKYLLFIGDDDFVSPFIMDIVHLMEDYGVESLTYPIAGYFYDNVEFYKKYAFNNPSTLEIVKNYNLEIVKKRTSEALDKVCNSGAVYIGELPRLYHGITSKRLFEKTKEKYHKAIPGPCPDMTLSMALAETIDEYYYIKYPVTVSGASSASEGGKGPTKKHVVRLEDKKWLNQDDIKDWDPNLPRIFSRETIWAQCVYHVLRISNDERKINYLKLYSSMMVDCPSKAIESILPLYKEYLRSNKKSSFKIFSDYLKRYIKVLVFWLPSFVIETLVLVRGDYKTLNCVKGLSNVDQCMLYIKNNYPIKK